MANREVPMPDAVQGHGTTQSPNGMDCEAAQTAVESKPVAGGSQADKGAVVEDKTSSQEETKGSLQSTASTHAAVGVSSSGASSSGGVAESSSTTRSAGESSAPEASAQAPSSTDQTSTDGSAPVAVGAATAPSDADCERPAKRQHIGDAPTSAPMVQAQVVSSGSGSISSAPLQAAVVSPVASEANKLLTTTPVTNFPASAQRITATPVSVAVSAAPTAATDATVAADTSKPIQVAVQPYAAQVVAEGAKTLDMTEQKLKRFDTATQSWVDLPTATTIPGASVISVGSQNLTPASMFPQAIPATAVQGAPGGQGQIEKDTLTAEVVLALCGMRDSAPHYGGWGNNQSNSWVGGGNGPSSAINDLSTPKRASNGRAGKRNLSSETVHILKTWFEEHSDWPYPNDHEQEVLSKKTGIPSKMVNTWFINARKRRKHAEKANGRTPSGVGGTPPSSGPVVTVGSGGLVLSTIPVNPNAALQPHAATAAAVVSGTGGAMNQTPVSTGGS